MERNRTLLVGPALRVVGAAGLLTLTAAVVLTVGGAGVFGTLGSILGTGDARAGDDAETVADARTARRFAALVADPGSVTATALARRGAGGDRRGNGDRRRARGPGSPPARPPAAAPSPQPGGPAPAPAPAPGNPPDAPPPGQGPVVDTVAGAVDEVVEQTPAPAGPLVAPVQQLVDRLAQECGRLPACP